jgi:tryptophan synthase beta subunit
MKLFYSIVAFSVLTLVPNLSFSQTVNDIPVTEIDVEYIRIVGTSKTFSNKITVEVDFGQQTKFFGKNRMVVKNEEGKLVEFNSMVDALNFFSGIGFEFVTAYAFAVDSGQQVYHYLLRKTE